MTWDYAEANPSQMLLATTSDALVRWLKSWSV